MTAQEYRIENEKLMEKWEKDCRDWLRNEGRDSYLVENIPFFRDGVVCPEVWFEKGNTFKPLVILKEVSLGIDSVKKLPEFLETWPGKTFFKFAECPFDDIRVGKFPQWKRIAKLAKGLEEVQNGIENCDYYGKNKDYHFVPGEMYTGEINGYKDPKRYLIRNANANYNEIINKIALLELKKVGGGTYVNSSLSLASEHYFSHVEKFRDNIYKQIELIKPTMIICLGKENGEFVGKNQILADIRKDITEKDGIAWIDGWHHSRSSNVNFYEKPLDEYRKYLADNK